MNLNKLFNRRLVTEASKYIFLSKTNIISSCGLNLVRQVFHVTETAMAQRSITSFFNVTSPKSAADKAKEIKVEKEESLPIANGNEKRSSKRARLDSSGSESEALNKVSPTVSSEKKKKSKRQRIESSGSESEPSSPKSDVRSQESEKLSPKSVKSSPKSPKQEKIKIKVEKSDTPKTYASPKSKKSKPKILKVVEENLDKKKSPKETPADSPKVKKSKRSPSPNNKEVKKELSNGTSSDGKENEDAKCKTEDDEDTSEVVPVTEAEYNPAKSKYHPIKDACWSRGKPVPYLALAKTFEAIEPISARLKIIEILSNYFRSVIVLTPEDLLASVYLCLNQLAPAYHSLELGIAETYLMKAVGACTGRTLAQLRAAAARGGDLGAVAEQARATQRTMFPQPPLTVRKVFAALKDIAHMTGHASVNKKIAKIQSLYVACRHSEARYLIRCLEGKLRIGLAEQSVLQALALATAATPPAPAPGGVCVLDASKGISADKFKARVDENSIIIKTTYCECPNYEAIIPVLLQHGVQALPLHCRLTVGVPLKPMLAHPTKGVHEVFNRFEGEEFTCEWKYDGERAQLHVPGGAAPDLARCAIFSRNQEDNTSKYPDVVRRVPALLKPSVSSCVLDCEAVAYDTENKQILPFQILSTRKRKDAAEADIKVQVCVFVFDLLFLNGEPLVRRPLARRRALLREYFNEVEGQWQFATSRDCKDMEEVQSFLEESVKGSCEGLMVKTLNGPHAHYDIARRSHNWLKLKKDYLDGVGDTIDVVVIGAYSGRGKRRAGFGGFLAACRDPDTDSYQALCKLGTGFSDEDLVNFTELLKKHEIPQPRNYYQYDSSHSPDAWFAAACVWEVRCADLSLSPAHRAARGLVDPDKGISLRFPRFVRVREDKTPEQATTAQQIAEMYLSQDQVKNTTSKPNYNIDDFY